MRNCYLIEERVTPRDPCNPSPCGPNSVCRIQNKQAVCSCAKNFIGDPGQGCNPECLLNSDCKATEACNQNQKCVNPCTKETCGKFLTFLL